jgi:formylglycine-generating enzyme required for sulfatase activity
MLNPTDPREVFLIRDALKPFTPELRDALWQKAEGAASSRQPFMALAVLATYDPDNPRWPALGEVIVERLLTAQSIQVENLQLPVPDMETLVRAFHPVRGSLLEPLADVCRGRRLGEQKATAALILAWYAEDRPEWLTDLALDLEPREYLKMLVMLYMKKEKVIPLLVAELYKAAPDNASDADKDRLAMRQANSAITLLHLERQPDRVWEMMKHSPDPSRRTYLIHHLAPYGVEVQKIEDRLKHETDVSVRRALLLSLGNYDPKALGWKRDNLVAELVQVYRDDPDPGIHGATEWLMRQWKLEGQLPKMRDHKPKDVPKGKTTWYVNGQGQTFTVIPGPVEFQMGSPESETDRILNERRHLRKIPRSFALATKEVTVAEFRRFLQDNPVIKDRFDQEGQVTSFLKKFSPDDDGPIILTDWFMAAAYCNWLSKKEGLPEKEWCYPKDPDEIIPGMRLEAGYLKRKGYRLPTEAEWEYACRAGAVTSRFYGRSDVLLGQYAWNLRNAGERTHPVGRLRPNDFGLFDMLGNAGEWCQDVYRVYPGEDTVEDTEEIIQFDSPSRVMRGGAFDKPGASLRSARRMADPSVSRIVTVGLRVARTLD